MSGFKGPYPVAAVVDRLKANAGSLRQVGRAAELRAAIANPPSVKAAAFVLVSERAHPASGMTGKLKQRVDVSLGVVLFVRNYAGRRGETSLVDAEALSTETRGVLLGWTPTNHIAALELQAARSEQYDGGQLWWQDVYLTHYRLEASQS